MIFVDNEPNMVKDIGGQERKNIIIFVQSICCDWLITQGKCFMRKDDVDESMQTMSHCNQGSNIYLNIR